MAKGWWKLGLWMAAIASLALCGAMGAAVAQEKPKMPADFTFEQGAGSPGKVTFSHDKHHEKNPKCTSCHTKVFKMKKGTSGQITMAAMDKGEFCGACHNGKEAFATNDKAGCNKCHVK